MKKENPKKSLEQTLNYTQVLIDRTQKGQNFNPKAVLKAYKINKKRSLFDIKGFKYKLMSKFHGLDIVWMVWIMLLLQEIQFCLVCLRVHIV